MPNNRFNRMTCSRDCPNFGRIPVDPRFHVAKTLHASRYRNDARLWFCRSDPDCGGVQVAALDPVPPTREPVNAVLGRRVLFSQMVAAEVPP
jgi:hypothetical protein